MCGEHNGLWSITVMDLDLLHGAVVPGADGGRLLYSIAIAHAVYRGNDAL